jgi:hypothetical protein
MDPLRIKRLKRDFGHSSKIVFSKDLWVNMGQKTGRNSQNIFQTDVGNNAEKGGTTILGKV